MTMPDLGFVVTNTAGDTSMFDHIAVVGVPYVRLVHYYDHANYLANRFEPDVEAALTAGLEPYGNLHPDPASQSTPTLQAWTEAWEDAIEALPGVEHWSIGNEPNAGGWWPWGFQHFISF
jgi:hypothetical protein